MTVEVQAYFSIFATEPPPMQDVDRKPYKQGGDVRLTSQGILIVGTR